MIRQKSGELIEWKRLTNLGKELVVDRYVVLAPILVCPVLVSLV